MAKSKSNKNKNKDKGKDKDEKSDFVVARNKKARFDYDILETLEAGIVLNGSEVKSLREGNAVLTGAFVRIKKGELFLEGLEIQAYSHASRQTNIHTNREKKLLLHRSEIDKWSHQMDIKHLTIVALKLYFTRGMAKVAIGLAKGKKTHDKRQDLKRKDTQRGLDRLRKLSR